MCALRCTHLEREPRTIWVMMPMGPPNRVVASWEHWSKKGPISSKSICGVCVGQHNTAACIGGRGETDYDDHTGFAMLVATQPVGCWDSWDKLGG